MFPLLLIGADPAIDQIERCAAAVHGDLPSAALVCHRPKESIDLFGPKQNPSAACEAALAAGVSAGKYGPGLPLQFRDGLIREFDNKLEKCKNPEIEKPIPMRDTVNLWD